MDARRDGVPINRNGSNRNRMKTEHRAWLAKIPNTDGQMGIYVDGELVIIYMKGYDGDIQKDLELIKQTL